MPHCCHVIFVLLEIRFEIASGMLAMASRAVSGTHSFEPVVQNLQSDGLPALDQSWLLPQASVRCNQTAYAWWTIHWLVTLLRAHLSLSMPCMFHAE